MTNATVISEDDELCNYFTAHFPLAHWDIGSNLSSHLSGSITSISGTCDVMLHKLEKKYQ